MIREPGDVPEPDLPALGLSKSNPFRIMALMNSRAVGDTIFYQVFAGSVKRLFDHSQLNIYMRTDRKYKLDLLRMNPEFRVAVLQDESRECISVDNFQLANDISAMKLEIPDYITKYEPWQEHDLGASHLILSPIGMPEEQLGSFDDPALLRIPGNLEERLANQLKGFGVDDKNWFCVLNYREPGYEHRPARPLKDQIPEHYLQVSNFIIDELGGQVVRVGHPNMTPFPAKKGFVDLAVLEDRFMLHAFAVTRARFMVASLTGIGHLGSAVGTPTIMTNCISHPCSAGVWRKEDIALYIKMYSPNDEFLPTAEQHRLGLFGSFDLVRLAKTKGYKFVRNFPPEMNAAVKIMMESTMNCQNWREPKSHEVAGRRPNRFEFPMVPRRNHRIVEFPEMAAKFPG